jgi:hypothetical protein
LLFNKKTELMKEWKGFVGVLLADQLVRERESWFSLADSLWFMHGFGMVERAVFERRLAERVERRNSEGCCCLCLVEEKWSM